MFTPDRIDRLEPNQIFVFGSNLQGHHGGGAARTAHQKFGAIWGQGVGLQGQSYAIPTMQGGVETIKPYVDEFLSFANAHREYTFLVTRIGCGIAGFKDEEIAPLFREAMDYYNIILPREFAEILALPKSAKRTLMKHTHGQVRTMADIVIALNKENHYKSPNEALGGLNDYFSRFAECGDDIAFLAVRILWRSLHVAFPQGQLDVDSLLKRVENIDFSLAEWDEAYLSYSLDKLLKIIIYLNDFRRYKNAGSILDDIEQIGIFNFSHCSPQREPYYFNFANYPKYFFSRGLGDNWDKLTTNGILDNQKLNDLMFDRHQRRIKKYGLDAVIRHDFRQDACHTEVFAPYMIGTAPVYVKTPRGFIKSCGEGKGPHSIPDYYEISYALPLLETSPDYRKVGEYFIPVKDYTLPIYHRWMGKVELPPNQTPFKFIEDLTERSGRL